MSHLVPTRMQRVDGVWTTVRRLPQKAQSSVATASIRIQPPVDQELPATREQALALLGEVEMSAPDYLGAQRRVWRRGDVIIKLERWDDADYNWREWHLAERLRTADVDFEVPPMRLLSGIENAPGLHGDILVARYVEGEPVHREHAECDCPDTCWLDVVGEHLEDRSSDNVLRQPDDTYAVIDLAGPM